MKNYLFQYGLIVLLILNLTNDQELFAYRRSSNTIDNDQEQEFPEDFPDDFDYKQELFLYVSSGWLPIPFQKQAVLIGFNNLNKVDEVRNLRTSSFEYTTNPLQGNVLFRDRYRAFPDDYFLSVIPFGSDISENQLKTNPNIMEFSIDYFHQGFFSFNQHIKIGYRGSRSLLTSLDTSRFYLSLSGIKKNFTEITTVEIFENRFFVNSKVMIPLYGLYLIQEDYSVSSVYYLLGAYDLEYVISLNVHQYVQIADAKQDLRYENGTDIQTIEVKENIKTLNRFRTNIYFGGGIDFASSLSRLQLELFASYPTRSILTDASWREFTWGIRVNVGFNF